MKRASILYLVGVLLFLPFILGSASAQGELVVSDGDIIKILTTSTYERNSVQGTFSGRVNGEGVTAASITFGEDVEGTVIFKNVATQRLIIDEGAQLELQLEGADDANHLGEIVNNGEVFFRGSSFAFSDDKAPVNNALFTDSTVSVGVVGGPANLIVGICEGEDVHNEPVAPLKGIVVTEAAPEYVTFIWQYKNVLWWQDVDTVQVPVRGGRIITCYHETKRAGLHRFRAIVQKGEATTSLISGSTTIEKTYDVDLKETKGAVTDPAAGIHLLREGENFKFYLALEEGYRKSEPVVVTSKGDTIPKGLEEGYYTLRHVTDSVHIYIYDVKEDNPTSNQELLSDDIRILTGQGQIEIFTPEAIQVQLFTPEGILRKNQRFTAGNHILSVTPGIYFLKTEKKVYKVMVN